MKTTFTPVLSAASATADQIWDVFARQSFIIVDDFLSPIEITNLRQDLSHISSDTPLTQAGMGFGAARQADASIRGDFIRWIEPSDFAQAPQLHAVMTRLGGLRKSCNKALYCGLQGFEAHYAHYPPGAGYHRHIDKLKNAPDERFLSFVLYLNDKWQDAHGGQLRLYTNNLSPDVREACPDHYDVAPRGGRLALFRSDEVWHQVLGTTVDRHSVTGWFLRHVDHLRAVLK